MVDNRFWHRQYILASGLIVLALISAALVFNLTKTASYLSLISDICVNQDKIIETMDLELNRLEENETRLNELSDMLDGEDARVIMYNNLPGFFVRLSDYMVKLGIEEELFQIGAEEAAEQDNVIRTPLTVSGYGDYFSVRDYITRLSHYDLKELRMSSAEVKRDGCVYFRAHLDVYSYENGNTKVAAPKKRSPFNPFYYEKLY